VVSPGHHRVEAQRSSSGAAHGEVDKADRNNDGLICYKVEGRNVILIEMLPF
jgi:hypothetical protein